MKPCPDCPFSRAVKPGALGGSNPTVYVGQSIGPYVIPCHKHIDYEDSQWRENCISIPSCRGAAIFRANIGVAETLPPALLRLPEDTELVFANHAEFLAHHIRCSVPVAEAILKERPPEEYLAAQLARKCNIIYQVEKA